MHLASSNPSRMGSPLGSWRCCGGRVTRNGSRLKAIDLSATRMANSGATALFEALRRNRALTTLRAAGNRLGLPSWQVVARPISHTPFLSLTHRSP